MISNLGNKIYLTLINHWSWWWEVDNKEDELARTILTVAVVTLVPIWYKLISSYARKRTAPLPPGPRGLPIVGYLPFITSNLHERFTEMARIYGPIFKLKLGSKLHVVVNSVDLAKAIVRDQDQIFANRSPPLVATVLSLGGSDIGWANNNAHWRNMRKLLVSQVLSGTNLEACRCFRREEVRKTVNDICGKMGTKMNINEIAFVTELNVVTSMLWGRSKSGEGKNSLGAEFREVEFKIVELLGLPNISDFFPVLSWLDLQGRAREMERQATYLYRIFDRLIEGRTKVNSGAYENDGRKDFLQILLELKEQKDAATAFNITHIKAILMDIVLAATDTTSTMTEWVMAEIMNDPEVMKRVQDELTKVIGLDNIVEESHLPNLQYLDAVIKETFRLHPPLPFLIPRCSGESCTVGGYRIPKGTTIFLNLWAIHRDPENWSNPSEFKPDRFLNYDGKNAWDYNGNNLKFLPFGAGRRICAGISLGEKMLMYILASLLHSFEWRLPEGEEFDLSDEFGIVTKKRKPLIVIPSQRLLDARLYL